MLPATPPPTPPTYECFQQEAARQALPEALLLAVMLTEGGRPGQWVRNTNGTHDIGPMQINTINLGDIARQAQVTPDHVAYALTVNGCSNVAVGAWFLRRKINEAGGDIWKGVAWYHSRTPAKGNAYVSRVHRNYLRIQAAIAARNTNPAPGSYTTGYGR